MDFVYNLKEKVVSFFTSSTSEIEQIDKISQIVSDVELQISSILKPQGNSPTSPQETLVLDSQDFSVTASKVANNQKSTEASEFLQMVKQEIEIDLPKILSNESHTIESGFNHIIELFGYFREDINPFNVTICASLLVALGNESKKLRKVVLGCTTQLLTLPSTSGLFGLLIDHLTSSDSFLFHSIAHCIYSCISYSDDSFIKPNFKKIEEAIIFCLYHDQHQHLGRGLYACFFSRFPLRKDEFLSIICYEVKCFLKDGVSDDFLTMLDTTQESIDLTELNDDSLSFISIPSFSSSLRIPPETSLSPHSTGCYLTTKNKEKKRFFKKTSVHRKTSKNISNQSSNLTRKSTKKIIQKVCTPKVKCNCKYIQNTVPLKADGTKDFIKFNKQRVSVKKIPNDVSNSITFKSTSSPQKRCTTLSAASSNTISSSKSPSVMNSIQTSSGPSSPSNSMSSLKDYTLSNAAFVSETLQAPTNPIKKRKASESLEDNFNTNRTKHAKVVTSNVKCASAFSFSNYFRSTAIYQTWSNYFSTSTTNVHSNTFNLPQN